MRKRKSKLKPTKSTKPKATNKFEARVSELDKHEPFKTCYVCDREGRDMQMIAPQKFRCHGCNPGSPNWCDYFERLEEAKRTDAHKLIYKSARRLA